jgi:hypothetical protein
MVGEPTDSKYTMREFMTIVNEAWQPEPVFYHGTFRENLPQIMRDGLRPDRSKSSQEAVFLTDCPGTASGYHLMHDGGRDWVILRIDFSQLDQNLLGPDNYEFQQMLDDMDRDGDDDPCAGMEWDDCSWQDSLRISNQVAYKGTIPPSAISIA